MLPLTEQGMNTPTAIPTCTVPFLQGQTLKAAREALRRSGCSLGPIRGHRTRGARIVKQYRPAGKTLPAGTEVGVKLGR
ncbi:MAG TPA: PASTA domain-containing protein [Solirubrobacterales bacterium]|nr:PASTA domain-containing protein [Solirubrobacterales bacterium]